MLIPRSREKESKGITRPMRMGVLAVVVNALIAREGIDVLSQTIETSSSDVVKLA
jgi:hypothetical protein